MPNRRLAAIGVVGLAVCCFAAARHVREELAHLEEETGVALAEFKDGSISFAPWRPREGKWRQQKLAGSAGKAAKGTLSHDGSLVAFDRKQGEPPHEISWLAIASADGTLDRDFRDLRNPGSLCWSADNAWLAVTAQHGDSGRSDSPNSKARKLLIVNVAADAVSGAGSTIEEAADAHRLWLTTQCWSPDGQQLVYSVADNDEDPVPGTIRIYDRHSRQSRDLLRLERHCKKNAWCIEPAPTWSPDGQWIAFFDQKAYRAVRPSGQNEKLLFSRHGGVSGAYWSPDSRYVAYGDCCLLWETLKCMCEVGRVRVRRLEDNADDWVWTDGWSGLMYGDWQWINPAREQK